MGTGHPKKSLKRSAAGRAVFLDRDGVINRVAIRGGRPYPPSTLKDLRFLPRVRRAVKDLKRAGFKVIVVTNQPDVGKGLQKRDVVESMHRLIAAELGTDAIKVCYHEEADRCVCRKPKTGMLTEAAAEWKLDLGRSFLVGDRWRDIEAGKKAGCRTVLIESSYKETEAKDPDAVASSLWEASRLILSAWGKHDGT